MKYLSQLQLLALWSELEACYYGKNRYAGDTCEIYASTLHTFVHCANLPEGTSFGDQARSLQAAYAMQSLLDTLYEFKKSKPGVVIKVEGTPIVDWAEKSGTEFVGRLHIQITRSEG